MSIIEKAVNAALGKRDDEGGVPKDTAAPAHERAGGFDTAATAAAATVQKAAGKPASAAADSRSGQGRGGLQGRYVELDFDDLRKLGVLTPLVPRSAIAEEFRTIKRPLLTNIFSADAGEKIEHANLIMVTSALEGDGKTFTSLSLAISIAMEQDKTVLYVDADTAKAEAGRILGIPAHTPGLIDVLENPDMSLADVILHTNIDNLRVLPAGDLHAHANELLASERMRELMLEISRYYSDRVIVFDSPPLLLTTEASVLASFMGQIVFVVSAELTPQHAVNQAIEYIGEDKMVGMVLNRARRLSTPYYYANGEVYGYGRDRQSAAYGYGMSGSEQR